MLRHLEKAKTRLETDKDVVSSRLMIIRMEIASKISAGGTKGDSVAEEGFLRILRREGY